MTIEDGMFLASEGSVKSKVVARRSLSSAALGNEGLFNLSLYGSGAAALESNVPASELIRIELNNDELKIDGSMAVCWSLPSKGPPRPCLDRPSTGKVWSMCTGGPASS